MNQSYRVGRFVLALTGAYHLLVGLPLLVSGELSIRAARAFWGMTIAGSPELGVAGEILSCYMLAFGIMMLAAAKDPVKNRACVSIGAALCGLRVLQRLVFAGKTMAVFSITPARYWAHTGAVLAIGLVLAHMRWSILKETPSQAS